MSNPNPYQAPNEKCEGEPHANLQLVERVYVALFFLVLVTALAAIWYLG